MAEATDHVTKVKNIIIKSKCSILGLNKVGHEVIIKCKCLNDGTKLDQNLDKEYKWPARLSGAGPTRYYLGSQVLKSDTEITIVDYGNIIYGRPTFY